VEESFLNFEGLTPNLLPSLKDEKLDEETLNQIESIVQKIEDGEVRKGLREVLIKGAKLEQYRKKSK
jgi:hypothetical protein